MRKKDPVQVMLTVNLPVSVIFTIIPGDDDHDPITQSVRLDPIQSVTESSVYEQMTSEDFAELEQLVAAEVAKQG